MEWMEIKTFSRIVVSHEVEFIYKGKMEINISILLTHSWGMINYLSSRRRLMNIIKVAP